MKGVLLGLVLVLTVAPVANALLVELSLDSINPAPDAIDVVPDEVIAMYVISDSNGVSYWEEFYDPAIGTINNLQSYPAAGDLADISIIAPGHFQVSADDSIDNILAGMHFSFDITIASDATPGDWAYFHMFHDPGPTDTIRLNVVPEPGTIALLALGGLFLRKRRKG